MGLDGVELVMEFEKKFGITISDGEAERMLTPGDTLNFVILTLSQRDASEIKTHPSVVQYIHPNGSVNERAVWNEIRRIVSEQMGIAESRIHRESRYVEDLGVS